MTTRSTDSVATPRERGEAPTPETQQASDRPALPALGWEIREQVFITIDATRQSRMLLLQHMASADAVDGRTVEIAQTLVGDHLAFLVSKGGAVVFTVRVSLETLVLAALNLETRTRPVVPVCSAAEEAPR